MNTKLLIAPRKMPLNVLTANTMEQLVTFVQGKNYSDGISKANELLTLEPENLVAKKYLAFCLGMSGALFEAKSYWLQLIEADPFSEEYLLNLAYVEQKLGRLDSAIGLLELATEYHPASAKPWMSLGETFSLKGELQNSIDASLNVIKRQPQNAEAFQNLGSNFFALAMFDEAEHAFQTALLLNPNIQEAKSSLSAVLFRKNQTKVAAELLEELIAQHHPSNRMSLAQIKWNAALMQLRLGNLQKGWSYYEEGLSPEVQGSKTRKPHRSFNVPRWTPNSPKGQTVLVWREQGIGDDVIFMTCLQDLIDAGYKPIVECDVRMIELFKRSFQGIEARESLYEIEFPYGSPYQDFDSHIPMGSLMMHFRPSLNSFVKGSGTYLKVDTNKYKFWQDRIRGLRKNKKLIGISWKGGLTDAVGQLKYSKLSDWSYLLQSNEFEFISLQFGECEEEIQHVEASLGIQIHRWADLDLKNDIDDICALIANLDHVVTISSAVWTFSAALGAKTSLLLSSPHWTMFDQNFIPFFTNVSCFCSEENKPINSLLPSIKDHISNQ